MHEFPIIQVPPEDRVLDEPMGTKRKFWVRAGAGQRWLFKFSRPGTGEHWSEKIAAEIGAALGIPCASVELGSCQGDPGACVHAFPTREVSASLVHGNELLQEIDPSYPLTQFRGVSKHTVRAVLDRLAGTIGPPSAPQPVADDGAACFVGYLLLDALIANGDRHHENWGVIRPDAGGPRALAPSYDHASSLGRELPDEQRAARLSTRDPRYTVKHYVERGRSAFYRSEGDAKPVSMFDAFSVAAELKPDAATFWLAQLAACGHNPLEEIIRAVPSSTMSETSRLFAIEMLRITRAILLGENA